MNITPDAWQADSEALRARAQQAEARIADALALCDEWAAMGTRQMSIGAVRRALDGTGHPPAE